MFHKKITWQETSLNTVSYLVKYKTLSNHIMSNLNFRFVGYKSNKNEIFESTVYVYNILKKISKDMENPIHS